MTVFYLFINLRNFLKFLFFFRKLVKVSVKSRVVQVAGKRGKLVRSFRHARVDISMPKKNLIVVEKWFGTNKENAVVRTICSHINNMIKGVTKVSLKYI
jgi:large subunit ribosomal protein L9e